MKGCAIKIKETKLKRQPFRIYKKKKPQIKRKRVFSLERESLRSFEEKNWRNHKILKMFCLRFFGILSEETKLHGHHLIIENLKKNILRLEINEKVRVKFRCKLKKVHTYKKVKKNWKRLGDYELRHRPKKTVFEKLEESLILSIISRVKNFWYKLSEIQTYGKVKEEE